jgi:hypothetical protein
MCLFYPEIMEKRDGEKRCLKLDDDFKNGRFKKWSVLGGMEEVRNNTV